MLLAVRTSSYGCTWEVWRALKKLAAAPRATLTLLSCSPNFPRASITRCTHAKHEPIAKGRESKHLEKNSCLRKHDKTDTNPASKQRPSHRTFCQTAQVLATITLRLHLSPRQTENYPDLPVIPPSTIPLSFRFLPA